LIKAEQRYDETHRGLKLLEPMIGDFCNPSLDELHGSGSKRKSERKELRSSAKLSRPSEPG
jgi:hypothetical protein